MAEAKKRDRGQLRIDEEECKGCGLCIEACPPKVISMSERINHYGYRTALTRAPAAQAAESASWCARSRERSPCCAW